MVNESSSWSSSESIHQYKLTYILQRPVPDVDCLLRRLDGQQAPAPAAATRQNRPVIAAPGGNCRKIGLPGKLILSKSKGLRKVIIS